MRGRERADGATSASLCLGLAIFPRLGQLLSELWTDVVCLPPPDQELFSGMYIDFMGTDAAVFRSLTRRNAVRTDQHNSKWLSGELTLLYICTVVTFHSLLLIAIPVSHSEPIFIDAHLIPDGSDPNDAKLYFFFRERLTDNSGNTKNIHTMVARVCPVSAFSPVPE